MSAEEKLYPVVEQLLALLLDDPRALTLTTASSDGRVKWYGKVDINDVGKVIGKQGAHLYALRVILKIMGRKCKEDWRFEIVDAEPGERKDGRRIPLATSYNPEGIQTFLALLLSCFCNDTVNLTVGKDGTSANSYIFVLRARDVKDYELLATSIMVGAVEQTPIAALGTLFRAYGRQQGAILRVEVPPL